MVFAAILAFTRIITIQFNLMKHVALCIAMVGMAIGMHAQKLSDKIFDFDFSKVESGKDLIATFGEPVELRLDGDSEKWIFEEGEQRLYVAVKAGEVADFRFSQQDKDHFLEAMLSASDVMELKGRHIEDITKDLGPPMEVSIRPEGERWTFRSETQRLSLQLDSKDRTVKDLHFSSRN